MYNNHFANVRKIVFTFTNVYDMMFTQGEMLMEGFIDMETLGYFLYMQEQENNEDQSDDTEEENDDLRISQN